MFNNEMFLSYFQYCKNENILRRKNTFHFCLKTESEYLNNNIIHDFYTRKCLNGIKPSYS